MSNKVNKGNNNRLKSRLKSSSICHYCKISVVKSTGGRLNDNAATIDHTYSRNDLIRMLIDNKYPSLKHKHTVLSCNKCNKDRNDKQQKDIYNLYNSLKEFDNIDKNLRLVDYIK